MHSSEFNGEGSRRRPPATPRLSLANFWHDVRVRSWIYQSIVVIGVIAMGAFLIGNAQDALGKQGITTGFAFLGNPAGFEIGERLIGFDSTDTFLRAYGVALLNTLKVAAASIVLATILGVVVGLGRLSSNLLARKISSMYVELFRNTPQLVLLIFCYTLLTKLPAPRAAISLADTAFLSNRGLSIPWVSSDVGLLLLLAALALGGILLWSTLKWVDRQRRKTSVPQSASFALAAVAAMAPILILKAVGPTYQITVPVLRGFNFIGGTVLTPEFLALLMGLSLYIAAFIAEIVRAGIQSVGRGQIEAAKAIGLGPVDIYRKIIFPQALRVMVPPATVQYVSIVKNSSLGVAIGYPELFSVNNTIGTLSGQVVEAIAIMMAIYLSISFVIAALMNIYNRMVQIRER